MLVLSRKQDQEIHVPEYGIKFRVLGINKKRVHIGIDAPKDVQVMRSELGPPNALEKSVSQADDCLDPGFVWPLGVRFVPEKAHPLPKKHSSYAKPFETLSSRPKPRFLTKPIYDPQYCGGSNDR